MPACAATVDLADVLARGDIWRGDAQPALTDQAVPTGYPALDAELPGGGWPRGNLTEILVDRRGIGEMRLVLPALARLSAAPGPLALVAPPWQPYAPAWAAAGVSPERLLLIRPGRQGAWCLEQVLKSGGFSAVLAWPDAAIDAQSLRRLQVAAAGQAVFAVLWRSTAMAAQASPAPLRLVLSSGATGLTVRILKRRGRPASRLVTLDFMRPERNSRVVAGAAFPSSGARSVVAASLA